MVDRFNVYIVGELEKIWISNGIVGNKRIVSETNAPPGLNKRSRTGFCRCRQVLQVVVIPRPEIQHVVFVTAVRVFQVSVRVSVEIGNRHGIHGNEALAIALGIVPIRRFHPHFERRRLWQGIALALPRRKGNGRRDNGIDVQNLRVVFGGDALEGRFMRGLGIEHVAVRLTFVAVCPVERHIVPGRVRRSGQR